MFLNLLFYKIFFKSNFYDCRKLVNYNIFGKMGEINFVFILFFLY